MAALHERALLAGIRSINVLELERAIADHKNFTTLSLAMGAADRAQEILEADLPELVLKVLGDGAEATIRAAEARGSLFRTELIDQDVPDAPLTQREIDAQIAADEPAEPIPTAAQAQRDPLTRGFVQSNPRAVAWAQWFSSQEIVEITGQTRRAIRDIVKAALEPRRDADDKWRGRPPARSARSIKKQVGLTSKQAQAVRNLERRMIDAGQRAARDGRFRRVTAFGDQLQYTVNPGGPSEAQLALAERQYSRALHQWRAMNIARTETITSASEGQRQTWLAAQKAGWLKGDEKREWIITPDDRLCPVCRRMAGQIRGLEERFDAGRYGFVIGPCAHPQCRCATGLVRADAVEGKQPLQPPAPAPKPKPKPKPSKPKKPKPKKPTPAPPPAPPPAPIGTPIPPAAPPGGAPSPMARVSWTDFGAKLPKNKARRELVEDGLNRALELLPPDLRERFLRILTDVKNIKFRWATASTKNVKVLGEFTTEYSASDRTLYELMMHGSRENHEVWNPWVVEHNSVMQDIIRRRNIGEFTDAEAQVAYKNWMSVNPQPEKFRLAEVDEFAGTLIHELTHGIDAEAGKNYFIRLGITPEWLKDGMQVQTQLAYYQGQATVTGSIVKPFKGAATDPNFAYAVTKPVEGLAEAVRFYFNGTIGKSSSGRTLTAQEWRDAYPELAGWVERVILGGS